MQQVNLHQQRLYSLIEAGIAFIAMLLPWTVEKVQVFQQANSSNMNGFRSWGFLVLIGVIGVIIASFMGDKTREFDKNTKKIALGSFAAITIGAIAYLIALNNAGKGQSLQYGGFDFSNAYSVSAGTGLWMALVAGIVGLAWVSGVLKNIAAKQAPSA